LLLLLLLPSLPLTAQHPIAGALKGAFQGSQAQVLFVLLVLVVPVGGSRW